MCVQSWADRLIRLLYYLPMERMKIEIEKSEYDRLKSREEKYLAYMDMLSYRWEDETYVDALCWKVAKLEEENKKLKEELEKLKSTYVYDAKQVRDIC